MRTKDEDRDEAQEQADPDRFVEQGRKKSVRIQSNKPKTEDEVDYPEGRANAYRAFLDLTMNIGVDKDTKRAKVKKAVPVRVFGYNYSGNFRENSQ